MSVMNKEELSKLILENQKEILWTDVAKADADTD